MITKKKYLLLSLYFFSVFSLSQTIDPNLISQLSPEQIEAAQEVLETKDLEDPESQDLIKIEESLVKKDEKNGEQNPKKFGYDFFSAMPTSLSAVGDLPLPNDYKISLNTSDPQLQPNREYTLCTVSH